MASVRPISQKTVLVVDDELPQREYLSDILRGSGFRVIASEDACGALAAVRMEPEIDLVITDLQLPGMNGLEFVSALRKVLPAAPVIMLTGHASVETYFRAFSLGVSEYINKPVEERELKKIVQSVIGQDDRRPSGRSEGHDVAAAGVAEGGVTIMKEQIETRGTEHSSKADDNTGRPNLTPLEYFRQVKSLLREGRQAEAFKLLKTAVRKYPDEPVLLSYYGRLQAIVDRRYRSGVETCRKAIEQIKTRENFDEGLAYPAFYLNLGKAYSVAGRRKDSVDALTKGLSYDPGNADILQELRQMGMRTRKPLISFLDRSNPLNKYLGLMLFKWNRTGAR